MSGRDEDVPDDRASNFRDQRERGRSIGSKQFHEVRLGALPESGLVQRIHGFAIARGLVPNRGDGLGGRQIYERS